MLTQHEKSEIIRRLQSAQHEEMTREEMEQLIDAEMAKPEAEIDTALVQHLLDQLEGDAPQPVSWEAEQQQSWRQISRKIGRRRLASAAACVARCAAVAALVVALFFATYQTAEAFHWNTLLRWMQPLAGMFTLYNAVAPDANLQHTQQDVPAADERGSVQGNDGGETAVQQINSYADAPETLQGYPVKPRGIPARFAFLQGSVYTDERLVTVSYVFTGGTDVCLFKVRILNEDEAIPSAYHYEKTLDETRETSVGTIRVTYYLNADSRTLSASWSAGNVQYSLVGELSREEISTVIRATMLE